MANSEFCFPTVTLINDDFNPCVNEEFDFSLFTTIDLTAYGGDFVQVSSNNDIVSAFLAIGIVVTVEGCLIYVPEDHGNIPVCGILRINLIGEGVCSGDQINYAAFSSIDLTQFGGEITVVNEDSDIVDNLFTLGFTATIDGCDIIIETCEVFEDIITIVDPFITIVDTDEGIIPCVAGEFDYESFDAVDLSFYDGPSEVEINSNADLINAFATLGITVVIEGCTITLVGYTEDVENIEACLFTRINIVDSGGTPLCDGDTIDFTSFNQINFTPYGGTLTTITNGQQLIDHLNSLIGTGVSIDGCDVILESCEIVAIDLEGSNADCANIEVEQELNLATEDFLVTLSAYIDPLIGANQPLIAGEILRVEIRDSLDTLIAFANTIIGQNWSTPAGIVGMSLNWLGATGFSSFTYTNVLDEGGGVLLNPNLLLTGLDFFFNKRGWAVANGYGGVGLGQDYNLSFTLPNLTTCEDIYELLIPKVVEGRTYDVSLWAFLESEEPGNTCCATPFSDFPDNSVGIFDGRFFDQSTLQVFNTTSWVNATVQNADQIDCVGAAISFPDPNDDNLRHVCLDAYSTPTDPTGIRINTKNHASILADLESPSLQVVSKGHIQLPIIKTETSLRKFLTTNPNPFPKQVVIEEHFNHFHDVTSPFLDETCPKNMIRADIYIANLPGLGQDPENGQVYHSSVPVNPIYPTPPGTFQNTFTNQTQQHSFPTEGVYVFKSEYEKGPECTGFSGDWEDPGCDSCAGAGADDINGDGEIINPEETTSLKVGFYVITSY